MSTRTNGIKAFFRYARARQQILLDRRAGKPAPWTKDEILRTYRFCNVHREDDKVTMWFKQYVREPLRESPRVLLATVVFRLFNRIETGEAIFCDDALLGIGHSAFAEFAEFGDVRVLRRAILKRLGKSGPYVTGAYIISSPPGYPKLDGVLEVIRRFHKNSDWQTWAKNMIEHPTPHGLEETWLWLSKQDYLGKFHSYEIVTDLRHTALLERAPDVMHWANPGPGAKRGANRIFRGNKGDHVTREQVIDEMRILLSWSRDPKLWPHDPSWPTWEMRTVEHTLCEFDKMERVRLGEGRPRGVYK